VLLLLSSLQKEKRREGEQQHTIGAYFLSTKLIYQPKPSPKNSTHQSIRKQASKYAIGREIFIPKRQRNATLTPPSLSFFTRSQPSPA
jgi:spore germination protein YaaH